MTGLAFIEWGVESWEDGKEGGWTKLSALGLQWLGQEVFRTLLPSPSLFLETDGRSSDFLAESLCDTLCKLLN